VDEGIGFFVTVAFLPMDWSTAIAGFFVFRALDIIKPPPARQLEALPGGWGIVIDDVVAGIYGNLVLRLLFFAMGSVGLI
jgi:phosphatidylglycerophosphatase A